MTSSFRDKVGRVLSDRASQHGTAEVTLNDISSMWSAYIGKKVTPSDVCMLMCLLKISRQKNGHNDDNLIDICGYSELSYMHENVRINNEDSPYIF